MGPFQVLVSIFSLQSVLSFKIISHLMERMDLTVIFFVIVALTEAIVFLDQI